LNTAKWNELKQQGSEHYKTGEVEPIDLYVAGQMFHDYAVSSIIKYAFRSRRSEPLESAKFAQNMDKIIDLAQKLKAFYGCSDEHSTQEPA
jgi:hypothetical protein